jgi:class 3 adenylate cyclase
MGLAGARPSDGDRALHSAMITGSFEGDSSNMDPSANSLEEPVLRGTSCARLEQLLDARNAEPHRRKEFDRLIENEFAAVRSILVLDMAGFSFSVRRNGIIHHLSLIRQMHNIVRPAITLGGGAVVKFEADNCYAVFANPATALRAALDVNLRLVENNRGKADDQIIQASIGIGYGNILLGCDDFYGDEVNLACKLGEDIAGRNEIFLSEGAHSQLSAAEWRFQRLDVSVSGIHFPAFKYLG